MRCFSAFWSGTDDIGDLRAESGPKMYFLGTLWSAVAVLYPSIKKHSQAHCYILLHFGDATINVV